VVALKVFSLTELRHVELQIVVGVSQGESKRLQTQGSPSFQIASEILYRIADLATRFAKYPTRSMAENQGGGKKGRPEYAVTGSARRIDQVRKPL